MTLKDTVYNPGHLFASMILFAMTLVFVRDDTFLDYTDAPVLLLVLLNDRLNSHKPRMFVKSEQYIWYIRTRRWVVACVWDRYHMYDMYRIMCMYVCWSFYSRMYHDVDEHIAHITWKIETLDMMLLLLLITTQQNHGSVQLWRSAIMEWMRLRVRSSLLSPRVPTRMTSMQVHFPVTVPCCAHCGHHDLSGHQGWPSPLFAIFEQTSLLS